jgi:pyocin large subunit-like protein
MSAPPVKTSALLRWLSILIVVAAVVVRFWPHGASAPQAVAPALPAASAPSVQAPAAGPRAFGEAVGFRSRERLDEHFQKHGREFGAATAADYLRLAQALRDRPAGGGVLERVRGDGVVTRFDRGSGAFIAFGDDGVIRTFFRPNDGERYFERQAARAHGAP